MTTFVAADSNRVGYRYILEDTNGFGITPANGKPRELRTTGNSVSAKKETKTSEEIRADRMTSDLIETGASSDGEVKGEFSFGTYDDFLAAALYATWTRPMGGDAFGDGSVAIATASTITISGKDASAYFVAGRRWKLEGWRNSANNRYVQVSAVAYNAGTQTTTVTVTANDLEVEATSEYAKILDANDVLIFANTSIRAGTAGASTFDSNGGNAFAAAIAAGQIRVGQFLFFDGLGRETGTIDVDAQPVAGDTLTIDDGVKQIVLQFGGNVPAGRLSVEIGVDALATAANVVDAITTQRVRGNISVDASAALEVVTVTNLLADGGSLAGTGGNIIVTDFAGGDATARGVFEVTSVSDDVIGVSPQPGTVAGGAKVVVKGSMLRNPSRDFVKQSFTLETAYEDVEQYFLTKGLRVDTGELSFSAGEIATASFNLKGTETARQKSRETVLLAAPYTPLSSTTTQVMNATVNVGDLEKNGEPLSDGIRSISLNFANNLREQRVIGKKFAAGIGAGRLGITGKASTYFADGELYDQFIEHKTVSLGWSLTDGDENHLRFLVPALKISNNPLAAQAGNQDVMQDLDWEAIRDPARDCMIQLDRFSSLQPALA